MQMASLQQRYLAALLARGEKQVPSRSGKVITVTRRQPKTFYYLGKNGSLRVGFAFSRSIPVNAKFKASLLSPPPAQAASRAPIPVNLQGLLS